LTVSDHGDSYDLTRLVLLDLSQQLVDRIHAPVLDGHDKVGGIRIDIAAKKQAELLFLDLGPLDARLLRRAPLVEGHDKEPLAGGVNPGDSQVSANDASVL